MSLTLHVELQELLDLDEVSDLVVHGVAETEAVDAVDAVADAQSLLLRQTARPHASHVQPDTVLFACSATATTACCCLSNLVASLYQVG